MANKRIKDLTEKSSFVSGDYFPIDNSNGTKKVNASKIMTPLSSAQTDATRALNMIRSTSSFPTGDAYSSSSSYKVGDMVIYNNTLYRCKTACSPASWSVNASNFEATSLASALTDLNNDLKQYYALDYANTTTVTLSGATEITISKRGVLTNNAFYATQAVTQYTYFYVNSKVVAMITLASNVRPDIYLPVEKGDKVKHTAASGTTMGNQTLYLIPYKVQ